MLCQDWKSVAIKNLNKKTTISSKLMEEQVMLPDDFADKRCMKRGK